MASIRCNACGTLHFVTVTHSRKGRQVSTVNAMIDCYCGGRTGFELRFPDALRTHESLLDVVPPGISDPVRRLFKDAEQAFWTGSFSAVMATLREAVVLSLRERGASGFDLRSVTDDAVALDLLDDGLASRLGFTGVVPNEPREFTVKVDRRDALTALQTVSVLFAHLPAGRFGPTRRDQSVGRNVTEITEVARPQITNLA